MADDAPAAKKGKSSPALAFWLRLGAAHFAAYPVAFAAAFAGVPLAMLVREDAVLRAASEAQAQRIVLEVCLVAGVAAYLFIHAAALPWCLGAAAVVRQQTGAAHRARRGRTIFFASMLGATVVGVLGALIGWVWLLTS